MSTPRKPKKEKLRPGRKPLSPEERPVNAGIRLIPRDRERLDALREPQESRQAAGLRLILDAIKRAEARKARASDAGR